MLRQLGWSSLQSWCPCKTKIQCMRELESCHISFWVIDFHAVAAEVPSPEDADTSWGLRHWPVNRGTKLCSQLERRASLNAPLLIQALLKFLITVSYHFLSMWQVAMEGREFPLAEAIYTAAVSHVRSSRPVAMQEWDWPRDLVWNYPFCLPRMGYYVWSRSDPTLPVISWLLDPAGESSVHCNTICQMTGACVKPLKS